MTESERKVIAERLAKIIALLMPAHLALGDGPIRDAYRMAVKLQSDVAANAPYDGRE